MKVLNQILIKLIERNRNVTQYQMCKLFHEEFTSKEPKIKEKKDEKVEITLGAVASKYDVFREIDSPIIFDINEERNRIKDNEIVEAGIIRNEFADINLVRGVTGVFEIYELVDVLRREQADDIFVCSVPKDIKYVDYMCVVTGRSKRHINAIAEFVRKVYKKKCSTGDILPKIEGEKNNDWIALDLGNIALHIFASETRKIYDLESLWSIGPEYDKECNKPQDSLIELYEKHSIYLSDLVPEDLNKDK